MSRKGILTTLYGSGLNGSATTSVAACAGAAPLSADGFSSCFFSSVFFSVCAGFAMFVPFVVFFFCFAPIVWVTPLGYVVTPYKSSQLFPMNVAFTSLSVRDPPHKPRRSDETNYSNHEE